MKALTHSPWGTYTVAFTIPLRCLWGSTCAICVRGVLAKCRDWPGVPDFRHYLWRLGGRKPTWAPYFDFTGVQLTWMLVGTVLWRRCCRCGCCWLRVTTFNLPENRDYRRSGGGHFDYAPTLTMPALTKFVDGTGPVWTVTCSRSCLSPSPVARCLASSTDLFRHYTEDAGERRAGVLIGYGGMLMESFVAIMALVSAVSSIRVCTSP